MLAKGHHRLLAIPLVLAAIALLGALFMQQAPPAQAQTLTDKQILEAFYDATSGPSWHIDTNWKTTADIGTWYGVATNADGRVTQLILTGNNLTGEIPSELGNLTSLIELHLNQNKFTGKIPAELGTLTSLTNLNLSENDLTGEIPSELGNLTSLRMLRAHTNQLSGEMPSELGNLTSMGDLFLNRNKLTGEIPAELGDLTELHTMVLSENGLTGEIPSELGSLAKLLIMNLSRNKLTGEIPSELGSLAKLQYLVLHDNGLSGEIPSEVGSLAKLLWLSLSNNQLSGGIPSELGSLASLTHLYLSNNQLTGEIPPELGGLTGLTILWLHDNDLIGGIPSELGDLASLQQLILRGNRLTGAMPSELGSLASLTTLWLSNNQLSGEIPSELGSLTALKLLWLDRNMLDGGIPVALGSLTNLQKLGLSCNNLSGTVPTEIGAIAGLMEIYLQGNLQLLLGAADLPSGLERMGRTVVLSGPCVGATAPGAPTALMLTPTDGQIRVSWSAPASDGGAAVTDYDVEYKESTAPSWQDAGHSGTTQTATITGLTNGRQYDVRVRAENSVGEGPWSTTAQATLTAPPATAPTGLVFAGNDGARTIVTWDVPPSGEVVTGYDVQVKETAAPDQPATPNGYLYTLHTGWGDMGHGSRAQAAHLNLFDGVEYDVRVRATNDSGVGPWSAPVTGTAGAIWSAELTVAAGILGCTNYNPATACSSKAILSDDEFTFDGADYTVDRLFFSAAAIGDPDQIIIQLEENIAALRGLTLVVDGVRYSLAEARYIEDQFPRRVDFLEPGVTWAANQKVKLALVADPPAAPAGFAVEDGFYNTLVVSWDAAAAGVRSYQLEYRASSLFAKIYPIGDDPTRGSVIVNIDAEDASPYFIHDLVTYERYNVRMRALGPGGYGPWSETLSAEPTDPAASRRWATHQETVELPGTGGAIGCDNTATNADHRCYTPETDWRGEQTGATAVGTTNPFFLYYGKRYFIEEVTLKDGVFRLRLDKDIPETIRKGGYLVLSVNRPDVDSNPHTEVLQLPGDSNFEVNAKLLTWSDVDGTWATTIGASNSVELYVYEHTDPKVRLSVDPNTPHVAEGGKATVRVTLNGPRENPSNVFVSLKGDARVGDDYTVSRGYDLLGDTGIIRLPFPAIQPGADSAYYDITFTINRDTLAEDEETIEIRADIGPENPSQNPDFPRLLTSDVYRDWSDEITLRIPENVGVPIALAWYSDGIPSGGELFLIWAPWATQDPGPEVTGYEVQHKTQRALDRAAADGGPSTGWVSATTGLTGTTNYPITGLSDGTLYDVRVRAIHAGGTGPWGTVALPGQVPQPQVVPGHERFDASWKAPILTAITENEDRKITRYEVQYQYHDENNQNVITSDNVVIDGMTAVITGLENGKRYNVRVRAVNDYGGGPWSPWRQAYPGFRPVAPGEVAGAIWSATLTPHFLGSVANGYGCMQDLGDVRACTERLTGYSFDFDDVSYEVRRLRIIGAGSLVINLDKSIPDSIGQGLVLHVGDREFAFADASISGQAATWANAGLDWSSGAGVSLSIAPGPPGVPTSIAVWEGHDEVVVTWAPPENPGPLEITHYEVRHREAGSGRDAWSILTSTAGRHSLRITGLTANTEQIVQVRAVSPAGHGEWSVMHNGTTLASNPIGLVFDRVTLTESGPAATVTVTIPASWTQSGKAYLSIGFGGSEEPRAEPGSDYTTKNFPNVFEQGERTKSFTVSALDGGLLEPDDEYFALSISGGPAGGDSFKAEPLFFTISGPSDFIGALTVDVSDNGRIQGCDNVLNDPGDPEPCTAQLSPDSFSYKGVSYTITRFYNSPGAKIVFVEFDPAPPPSFRGEYTMYVDGVAHDLATISWAAANNQVSFGTDGSAWNAGQEVSLRLRPKASGPLPQSGVQQSPGGQSSPGQEGQQGAPPEPGQLEPYNIQVTPGDGKLTVTWSVAPREGYANDEIRHALRWSQVSGVWANPPDPDGPGRNDGISVEGGVTSFTITGLQNDVATGVFVRSFTGSSLSERSDGSSEWVRTKGEHTTPRAGQSQQQQQATPKTYSVSPTTSAAEGGSAELTVTLSQDAPAEGVAFNVILHLDGSADESDVGTVPQTVAVASGARTATLAIPTTHDAVDEDDETFTVIVGTSAEGWTAASSGEDAAAVTIIDDDTAGVTITPATLSLAEDGSASYTVVLDSQPAGEVYVTPESADSGATFDPFPMVFTEDNWDTPQTVTLTGAADDDRDDESMTISHEVFSPDGKYNGIALASVTVAVTDTTPAQAEEPQGPPEPGQREPYNIQVTPGDGTLTVTWTVAPRDGFEDHEIRHALRWSQVSGVWANPPDPQGPGANDGITVAGGVTSYTITGLENGVATGVFVRSFTGSSLSERSEHSSQWVRVKGDHTTPKAAE